MALTIPHPQTGRRMSTRMVAAALVVAAGVGVGTYQLTTDTDGGGSSSNSADVFVGQVPSDGIAAWAEQNGLTGLSPASLGTVATENNGFPTTGRTERVPVNDYPFADNLRVDPPATASAVADGPGSNSLNIPTTDGASAVNAVNTDTYVAPSVIERSVGQAQPVNNHNFR